MASDERQGVGVRGDGLWDVAVLGAGAAGLCAAIRAAELGARVIVLEKNRKPGVKILMSGGTRCNLTNARGLRNLRVVSGPVDLGYDPREALGARSIQQAFGAGGKFLGPSLKALSVENSVSLFEDEGVVTKVEANGKVFPASDRAVDVLDALLARLRRSGALLRCQAVAESLECTEDRFVIRLNEDVLEARRVVVAVGGQSYPRCGTSGDGYSIARSFGHSVVQPRPALVPIRVTPAWVRDLSGLTLPDARAAVVDAAGRCLLERREAVLFAHFGLTGPAILDVSRAVARFEDDALPNLVLDLLPDLRAELLDRLIQESTRTGRRSAAVSLPEGIPRRLAEYLLVEAAIPVARIGPELSREERRRLVAVCKGLTLPIEGTLGFEKAEVTSGGVSLEEVDPHTLESRFRSGLHFAGEVLDLDGQIGGYNFQAAWSTGWLAGESAVRGAKAASTAQRLDPE